MLKIFLLRKKATNQACTFRFILNSGSLHQLSLLSYVAFCPMDQPNLTKNDTNGFMKHLVAMALGWWRY